MIISKMIKRKILKIQLSFKNIYIKLIIFQHYLKILILL